MTEDEEIKKVSKFGQLLAYYSISIATYTIIFVLLWQFFAWMFGLQEPLSFFFD